MLRSRTCIINYKKHIKLSNVTEKKNPRRCATLAANKIKIMSDTKEELSSSESVCTVKKNRRQLHGNGSAASRKKRISNSETDARLKSENEKGKLSGRKKLSCPESSAPKRKYISESENEETESEAEIKVTWKQDDDSHKPAHKSGCVAALNFEYNSSEEDSTNHKMENGRNWGNCSQSTSALNHCTNNSEEEVDCDLAKRETKNTRDTLNKKSRAPLKRSKLLNDLKETAESETVGKKDEKSSVPENVEARGTAGSAKVRINFSSDSDSETGNSNYSDATETRKRKRKSENVRKEITNSNSVKPSRRPQQRKRWKPNQENDSEDLDYTKYRRANRRSKIRTRNGGRRTVRYDDCDDDEDVRGLDDVHGET